MLRCSSDHPTIPWSLTYMSLGKRARTTYDCKCGGLLTRIGKPICVGMVDGPTLLDQNVICNDTRARLLWRYLCESCYTIGYGETHSNRVAIEFGEYVEPTKEEEEGILAYLDSL